MATTNPSSSNQPLHPLLTGETLTSTHVKQYPSIDVQQISAHFYKAEELGYLGRYDEAISQLKTADGHANLINSSPSYHFLVGTTKFQHGYPRDARNAFKRGRALLQKAVDDGKEISDGSRMLLAFLEARLTFTDPELKDANVKGVEAMTAAYRTWTEKKEVEELDYFGFLLERGFHDLSRKDKGFNTGETQFLARHEKIFEVHVPRGQALAAFPFILNKLNKLTTTPEALAFQKSINKLLTDNNAPQSLIDTTNGYLHTKLGQINNDKPAPHFKEGRRYYKAAGNIDAPTEIDLLETLTKGRDRLVKEFDKGLNRAVAKCLDDLGRLYSKFTDMNQPARMLTALQQMEKINTDMFGSQEIMRTICKLYRQLGLATGQPINATTRYVAIAKDLQTTDDIQDALDTCEEFRAEAEENWNAATEGSYFQIVAVAQYRLGMFDEAIQSLTDSKAAWEKAWNFTLAAEVRDEILSIKEKRLKSILSEEDKGYELDDMLEELDAAIEADANWEARWEKWLQKKTFKAYLMLTHARLLPEGKALEEGIKIINEVEASVKKLAQSNPALPVFDRETLILQVLVLQQQGKLDEAASLLGKHIPSTMKTLFRNRSYDDFLIEVDRRLTIVGLYHKDFIEPPENFSKSVKEKRAKTCLHHIEKAKKICMENQMAVSYCDCLYHEAIAQMALGKDQEAIANLDRAAILADDIRRAQPKGEKFDTFMANAGKGSTSLPAITNAALKACLRASNDTLVWAWIQHAKARAFTDIMQHGSLNDNFTRITDDIENLQGGFDDIALYGRQIVLIRALEEITKNPVGFSLNNWNEQEMQKAQNARRGKIQELMAEISQDPHLRGALSVSQGLPARPEDMTWLANYRNIEEDKEIVFVDWAHAYDQIIISAYIAGGWRGFSSGIAFQWQKRAQVNIFICKIGLKEVKAWVDTYMKGQDTPFDNERAYDDFDLIQELVTPLAGVTKPGDLLVLSPTDVLHGVPLHALTIDRKEDGSRIPLIERNPVVYTPSFSILRQCMARLRSADLRGGIAGTLRQSTLIGVKEDYGQPDPSVPETLTRIADSLGGDVITNHDCTRSRFIDEAANTTDILHFHGHMDYQDPKPLHRYLVLGGGEHITCRQLADLEFPKKTAPLVGLIACLSGGQEIMMGDEPVGVVSALLSAGASSVIATLWPTDSDVGLKFAQELYGDRKSVAENKVWDVAKAVQKAVLEIKNNEGTEAPYFWAPFCLHGAWLRGLGNCGTLPRGDGMGWLSQRFARGFEIII